MKKFKRNKKVFVVYNEKIIAGKIVDRNVEGLVCIKLANGEIVEYLREEIFYLLKDAEKKAEAVRAEHEQLMDEAREEYAQAYYADVIEQGLVSSFADV